MGGKHSKGKAKKPKIEQNHKKISSHQCQCSGSSQFPIQNDANYHQFLSLYNIEFKNDRTELIIYDTENEKLKVEILDSKITLDLFASITQLPNGELFCYGGFKDPGLTVIIDRNYEVRMLPSGTNCDSSSAHYFENAIYCFEGQYNGGLLALSRKFDLKNNRWIKLSRLPEADCHCNSVIFNGNILISGNYHKNIWLYSIEIGSFSRILYEFQEETRKLLINVERLYLIEWDDNGLIFESEDGYHWNPISELEELYNNQCQTYCLYNKEKIYISAGISYYKFDLKGKKFLEIK